ncbi:MAG: ribose-phosphate pyrophosphokinase, partial [Muribaculaceae bacterium]|nr:ribose-phosphate pyrophosphokinase [Muribaculaceae bacterium]
MSNQPFKIFSGTKSKYMALEIAKNLGVELGQMNIQRFADGEFQVSYEESVRGDEVYLVQSTFPNSDNLMELLLMVDAAKRASAKSVTAVIPYFGWARQDRKDKPRVSIAAKLVASMLTAAGVDSIITMDLHADQIQGFFDLPLNHLLASSVFIPYIKKLKLKDMVIASPDVGGVKRVNSYAKYFNVPLVMCHKQRARANVVEKMTIIGDVQDKNVILIDDMIDTAGTICTAAQVMMDNGAKSVRAIASHAIMSDPATERINKSALEEVVFT